MHSALGGEEDGDVGTGVVPEAANAKKRVATSPVATLYTSVALLKRQLRAPAKAVLQRRNLGGLLARLELDLGILFRGRLWHFRRSPCFKFALPWATYSTNARLVPNFRAPPN